ncbi:sugar phosphate isomerase/epimerase family protein [Planctomicrobium sp. SH664]|uniref:sugar phosphate isomerase/epimerase family protein n=1 Tax=Planctomicrobium sp. SH664 TaxID=3448125 RepID=UPI003F5B1F23
MLRAKVSMTTAALQLPIRQALQTARDFGADGVQLDVRHEISRREYGETARRQLLHSLKELGLQAASAHFPLRSPLHWPEHLDERLAAVRSAMDLAAQLKIRLLTLRIGRLPAQEEVADWELLVSLISDLAGHGNRVGVIPCLIPAGDAATNLMALIDGVKTGAVQVDGDLAGWVINRQQPIQELRALHSHLGHLEMRDAIREMDGPGREVPIGRGEIDWDEVAALLDEMEYSGWLNVNRTAGRDQAADLARGVQYVRNLFIPER